VLDVGDTDLVVPVCHVLPLSKLYSDAPEATAVSVTAVPLQTVLALAVSDVVVGKGFIFTVTVFDVAASQPALDFTFTV
jgi:hypothetical protein